jgi:polysaccharide export outer membrane protein
MTGPRIAGFVALCCLSGGLGGCGAPARPSLPVAEAEAAPAAGYLLGPGDTLTVFVHRAPELGAADVPVRPDGRLSLPLVPDIQAAGRTPTELARDVEERLKRYLREPNVTVITRSFIGLPNRQIRVIGEATQPLGMPYREGLTVLDVMIGARGLTRFAAGNSAEIIRRDPAAERGAGRREVIPVRLNDLLRAGDVSQDIAMRPGDTLVIPQGWF